MPVIISINVEHSGKIRSDMQRLKGRFQQHAEMSGVLSRALNTVKTPQHSGAEGFMQRRWGAIKGRDHFPWQIVKTLLCDATVVNFLCALAELRIFIPIGIEAFGSLGGALQTYDLRGRRMNQHPNPSSFNGSAWQYNAETGLA